MPALTKPAIGDESKSERRRMMEEATNQQRRPTAEEVIAKLKDEGDFDSLRLKIIRKVKENEELRNSIIEDVKQSEILNQDGSEDMKPRQLSDAIYQELGKKIMGRISDEVWKVIRNDSTKEDIRGTVESIYNGIMNPNPKEEDHHSPAANNASEQNGVPLAQASAEEANMQDDGEPHLPPGFSLCSQQAEQKEPHQENLLHLPSEKELHNPPEMVDDDLPPGFAVPNANADVATTSSRINMPVDMSQGSESIANEDVDIPPGFSSSAVVRMGGVNVDGLDEDDDDPDLPPGFG